MRILHLDGYLLPLRREAEDLCWRTRRLTAEAEAATRRLAAQSEAEAVRFENRSRCCRPAERAKAAAAYSEHPAPLKPQEFETLRDPAKNANARIYIGFDRELDKNRRD